MSDGPANGHEWAEHRLLAYSAGMLPEEEFLALEEHLRSCTDCRARLAELKNIAGVKEASGTISQEMLNRSLAASSRAEEVIVAQDIDF